IRLRPTHVKLRASLELGPFLFPSVSDRNPPGFTVKRSEKRRPARAKHFGPIGSAFERSRVFASLKRTVHLIDRQGSIQGLCQPGVQMAVASRDQEHLPASF